jgi:hypothetical protein
VARAQPLAARQPFAGMSNGQASLLVQRRRERVVVQRDGDFGLRSASIQDPYVASAVAWITEPANATKTASEYVDHLGTLAAADLTTMGCKPPTVANLDKGYSTFGRVAWAVEVNTLRVAGSASTLAKDLGVQKAAGLAGTVFHEFRHAEQYFKICQVLAGEGKTAGEIEAYTSMPADVVAQAVAKPMPKTATNAEDVATIKKWESITVGSNSNYKVMVNDMDDEMDEITALISKVTSTNRAATSTTLKAKMRRLKDHWMVQFGKEKTRLTSLTSPSAFDLTILGRVDQLLAAAKKVSDGWFALTKRTTAEIKSLLGDQKALNQLTFALYQAHDHEVDARATAAPVSSGVNTGLTPPPSTTPPPTTTAPPTTSSTPSSTGPASGPALSPSGVGGTGAETPKLTSKFAGLMSFWEAKK